MVSRFPYLLCAASKVRWGPLLPPPAFILNSHEVVEHFQTKASSYPAGTDGSPTPNLSETKEDSNRKKKKKKKTKKKSTPWFLPLPPPPPPSASSPLGPSGVATDACSKCASLVWEALSSSRQHRVFGERFI